MVRILADYALLRLVAVSYLRPKDTTDSGSSYQKLRYVITEKKMSGEVFSQMTIRECFVLTSVNEPEVAEEPGCVTGSPVGVKLEHEPGARTVEHVRYVREPPAQQP
jgi:hypothetical protein